MFISDQISCSVVSDSLRPHERSTPGLPVHHQLPEFTQTHVQWVSDAIQPYVPSTPAFLRVFIINGCWILSKAFSASIEIIIWFLFFNLLMWCITLIDLQVLKNPYISEMKSTWSWCMIFLMCCWILIARIVLRIFASMFISDIGL